MTIQKSAPSTVNRLAISENFDFYSNYEKTNRALTNFGRTIEINTSFIAFAKTKKRGIKSFKNHLKTPINHLNFVEVGNSRSKPTESFLSNRNFIRRLRRFEIGTFSKKNEINPKARRFGNYPKASIFKRFSFFKVQNEKSVPVLVSSLANTERTSQN
jgi:hypothetical protein